MNSNFLIVFVMIALTVACGVSSDAAEATKRSPSVVAGAAQPAAGKKLQAIRTMLIERMRASRQALRDALPLYEERLLAQRAEVEEKKRRYEQDLISKLDLEKSQEALASAEMDTERVRHWIAEDDRSLSLVDRNADAEMTQLRALVPDAYEEHGAFIRYNGVTRWSPALVAKVAKFFKARFGKELPVSAVGQSSTHDRLGYDHREAVDVAVSPRSREGRALITYLREARIPFLAFRGKMPGVSTGPHIHIGLPSPRAQLMEAKQHTVDAVASLQSGEGG